MLFFHKWIWGRSVQNISAGPRKKFKMKFQNFIFHPQKWGKPVQDLLILAISP